MVKSLILFLSWHLICSTTLAQNGSRLIAKCDCLDKKVQDSLIDHYLNNGADQHDYNTSVWGLYCDSLIAICPNIGASYQFKAIPFLKYADYETAFNLEDLAVKYDSSGYIAYRAFLKCIFTKDYAGALNDFKTAHRLAPGRYEMDHTYFFYEGLCYLELGNLNKAEIYFKKDLFAQTAGKVDYNAHFNSLLYTGILYYKSKSYFFAKKYLLKSINIYKQMPYSNYYLAMTYGKLGDIKTKKTYLDKARQFFKEGFGLNEGNVYYVNYPEQVKLDDVEFELRKIEKKNRY